MYELFKGGVDILFYAFAAIAIIGSIVKIKKAKKKDDK